MYKTAISIILIIQSIAIVKISSNQQALESPKQDTSSFDSLIASQCKAKCLSMYPWRVESSIILKRRSMGSNNKRFSLNQHQSHQGEIKWQKVMELCANNQICLQCSLPCDVPKNLLPNCKFLCQNRHASCIDSCELVQRLNEEKYGTCPPQNSSSNNEATPSPVQRCVKDSDCEDTQKCCSGNKCERAVMPPTADVPSAPYNLSIVERKKGKTLILSWQSDYQPSAPTIFVIEGQWALNTDSPSDELNSSMTKWGYLAQTVNNNWLILRSIHRGRWYRFRVAAVSKTGTYGYSVSTDLFMLSSAPKPASQPLNLTYSNVITKNDSHAHVDLSWLPPKKSDMPVESYVVSVYEFKNDTNVADGDFVETDFDDDDEDLVPVGNKVGSSDDKYFLYDEKVVKMRLVPLVVRLQRSYLIKVSAVSRYRLSELRSSAATIVVRMNLNERVVKEEISSVDFDNSLLINGLKLSGRPYFQNGLVKAKIAWMLNTNLLRAGASASEFKVTWFASKCAEGLSLPLPISARTANAFYEIYELRFGCDYVINVQFVDASGDFSLLKNIKAYSSMQLKVPACDSIQIVGSLKPMCELKAQSNAYLAQVTSRSSSTTTTASSKSSSTTSTEASYVPLDNLPLIINITHKAFKVNDELFNAEFRWKLQANPKAISKDALGLISGYQINIVPNMSAMKRSRSDVQSIAAIVDKKQAFFVATRLLYHVSYTFQIQVLFSDEFNEAIESYSDESDRFVMSKLSSYSVNFKVMPPKTRSKMRPTAQLHNNSLNYFYYLRNQNQNNLATKSFNAASSPKLSNNLISLIIVFAFSFFIIC